MCIEVGAYESHGRTLAICSYSTQLLILLLSPALICYPHVIAVCYPLSISSLLSVVDHHFYHQVIRILILI